MLPILNIGPLALQAPLLILLIGVWLGISLSEKQASKASLPEADIGNLLLVTLGTLVAGARLVFVIQNLPRYLDAPLGILLPNPDTLALLEGSVLAVIAAIVYGQRKNLPMWETLDVLIPGMILFLMAAAGKDLASGAAYGTPADLPWAIDLWGMKRHPVQAYEFLIDAVFLVMILRLGVSGKPGTRFFLGTALLAGGRLFVEGFRAEAFVIGNGWRVAQIVMLVVLLGALVMLRKRAGSS
jgi:prolipoprotein diacylglyceryltransferase